MSSPGSRWVALGAAAALVTVGLAGCTSAPRHRRPSGAGPAPPHAISAGDSGSLVERALATADSLVGRPYRYGGSDPSGFDCSGFTAFVLASVGIDVPRTTVQQAAAGFWVAADEIRAGDLVFFGAERDKPFHVGMIVSDPGQPLAMIHASTSRGVIRTEILSDSYWLPRLRFGRRYMALTRGGS